MDDYANTVIDRLGGTNAVAAIFEIKAPSVSEWRQTGIPKPRLQYIRLAFPDVVKDLDAAVPSEDSGKVPA
ncbi:MULTISPECIES: hypothetical protein [pseudomallei group]|uniref:hypothetical protein n=1 Tax=pseudomallei group TaxID=111527 RepID=UPI0005B6B1CB|nr:MULTISPECIES: hypothetical protein [pseudomallei group]AVR10280.1 hypothetical protein A8H31_23695 [Burkholderia thailandensis]KIS55750.1 DNA-binding transcriptional regulator Cro family protein [Burkholderia thailandensis Phuket 4W-1]VBK79175.1 Uncharacterised protein [Burkholderia pseudomallei]